MDKKLGRLLRPAGGLLYIGMLAVFSVAAALLNQYILAGVGIAVTCVTLGQLAGGLVIDAFELMRCEKIRLDRCRIVGMLVIAAGILLATMTKLV